MSYSTSGMIETELGNAELIRLTNPGGNIYDAGRVTAAIDFADMMIDGYIGGRYALPLPVASHGILQKISKDLAIFNLFEGAYAKQGVPNSIVWKRTNALSLLNKVACGDIRLPQTSEELPIIIINKTK